MCGYECDCMAVCVCIVYVCECAIVSKRRIHQLYLGHVVEFQVSLFQYGTDLGQERAGEREQ